MRRRVFLILLFSIWGIFINSVQPRNLSLRFPLVSKIVVDVPVVSPDSVLMFFSAESDIGFRSVVLAIEMDVHTNLTRQ
jgi:hypothetical protein